MSSKLVAGCQRKVGLRYASECGCHICMAFEWRGENSHILIPHNDKKDRCTEQVISPAKLSMHTTLPQALRFNVQASTHHFTTVIIISTTNTAH